MSKIQYLDNLIKGEEQEVEIYKLLQKTSYFNNKVVSRDLTIKISSDTATQIDNLLITQNAVYVIESKNYKGIVSGDCNEKKINKTTNNGITFTVTNPVFQNEKHIESIINLLNIPKHRVYSISVVGHDTVVGEIFGATTEYRMTRHKYLIKITELTALIRKIEKEQMSKLYSKKQLKSLKLMFKEIENDTEAKEIHRKMIEEIRLKNNSKYYRRKK